MTQGRIPPMCTFPWPPPISSAEAQGRPDARCKPMIELVRIQTTVQLTLTTELFSTAAPQY